jgi:chromosome partitioning protein
MRGTVVAGAMFKGGVGKTTIATNLAFYVADQGVRTLFIDCDAQGNASNTLAPAAWKRGDALHTYELFEKELPRDCSPVEVSPTLRLTCVKGGEPRLRLIDKLPRTVLSHFAKNVRALAEDYDLVLIDSPPAMNMGMEAPLVAADFVYSPIVCDDYSLQNFAELQETLARIRKDENPGMKFLGLLPSRVKSNDSLQLSILDGMKKKLSSLVIPHLVPESVPISRIQRHKTPLWRFATSGAERKASASIKAVGDWLMGAVLPTTLTSENARKVAR